MYHILLILLLQGITLITAQVQFPIAGHAYLLFNGYSGDNPYEYIAWTTDPSVGQDAAANNPVIYMESTRANVVPPHSLWVFDQQSDQTYNIYPTDNSYPGSRKRLDSYANGLKPFLGTISGNSLGQIWQLKAWSDGNGLEIYNVYWTKCLDINGGGVPNYQINAPFLGEPNVANSGQHWFLADWTPTVLVTATSITIILQTITPALVTSILGGNVVTVTVSTTVSTTEVIQTPDTFQSSNNKLTILRH
jgi:hypothetical protein